MTTLRYIFHHKKYWYRSYQMMVWVCVAIFLFVNANAQTEDLFRQILETKEYQKVMDAAKKNTEADALIKEVVGLNQELLALENDFGLSQREFEKESGKLDKQIQKKQQEAFNIYHASNTEIYTIVEAAFKRKTSITSFEEAQLEYELAREAKAEAEIKYKAGLESTPKEKAELLNEAVQQEEEAIGRLTTALGLLYGFDRDPEPEVLTSTDENDPIIATETLAGSATSEVESMPVPVQNQAYTPVSVGDTEFPITEQTYTQQQPEGNTVDNQASSVEVNETVIDKYNAYVGDPNQLPPVTFRSIQNSDLDFQQTDSLAKVYWVEYNSNSNVTEGSHTDENTYIPAVEPTEEAPDEGIIVDVPDKSASSDIVSTAVELPVQTVEEQGSVDEYMYKIQLAESKAPINQRLLQKIYNGEKQVQMLSEGGWYKYVIGDFESFSQANEFKQTWAINDGYVVRYKNDIAFIPAVFSDEVAAEVSSEEKPTYPPQRAVYYKIDNSQPEFRVQLAASRVPLSIHQFELMYKGDRTIHVADEDDWKKYQARSFASYDEAWRFAHESKVEGAFILAYQAGKRVDLLEARKLMDESSMPNGKGAKAYYVQVAASHYRLSDAALIQRYKATYPIAIAIEDGWFKYQIPAGISYEKAREIKENCGVADAFIISYYNGYKK